MIGFWVAAAVLAAGAGALMLQRAARATAVAEAADPQIEVYRRALAEIDDLADRDLLAEDERRSVRAEAARRLISSADRARPTVRASRRPFIPLAAAAAVALAALAIYFQVGSPGAADQPFAARLAAWKVNPETAPPEGLAAVLNAAAAERPGDVTPLRKLAALDLSIGDADGAAHALRRAMMIAPTDAGLAAMLGEVKVLQNGGALTPDARALFVRAIGDDPGQPAARYYLAKAKISDGDVAGGLADWRALLATLAAADPRGAVLAGEIAAVQRDGRLPTAAAQQAGPPSADMTAAIHGMVDGLAQRLRAQPDDPDGWVRLVRAYAVLGDAADRDQALAAARARYAGRPDELAALAAAARAAPMAGSGG
jgi:cytochrome c-type biogenesis protein CcmH